MVAITQFIAGSVMVFGVTQGLPQMQPSATAPAAPPASTEDSASLFRDLFTAPTAIKRFQRLLVQGETLLTGDALRKKVVFSFANPEPAPGANGGATKAANIETFPILAGLGISSTIGVLKACGTICFYHFLADQV